MFSKYSICLKDKFFFFHKNKIYLHNFFLCYNKYVTVSKQ